MKLLEINDLKERKIVPDSYEIGLVYKGRRVDILLDKLHYPYSADYQQSKLNTSSHIIMYFVLSSQRAKIQ